jgi:hypothetical protein
LLRKLGLSNSCHIVLDHKHILSDDFGAWPKKFGKVKSDCVELVKSYDKDVYDSCLGHVREQVEDFPNLMDYVLHPPDVCKPCHSTLCCQPGPTRECTGRIKSFLYSAEAWGKLLCVSCVANSCTFEETLRHISRAKAYFPTQQIGEWLEKNCTLKQRTKHCLSALREHTANTRLSQGGVCVES